MPRRPAGGRAAAGPTTLLGALAVLAVAGCGSPDPLESEGFADALRALATRTREAHPDVTLRVHDRRPSLQTEGDGATLPWAARQALTTAGVELADAERVGTTGDAVLHLLEVERDGEEWRFRVRLQRSGPASAPDPVVDEMAWKVICAEQCTLADSTHHGTATLAPRPTSGSS